MNGVLDPKSGQYLYRCAKCGETVHIPTAAALAIVRGIGMCQRCRAIRALDHLMAVGDTANYAIVAAWLDQNPPEHWDSMTRKK